jgi:hypothetical protein
MIAQRMLQVLQDIEGVTGSFVTGVSGNVLVLSMPPRFEARELALAASRIVRIFECAKAAGNQAEDCLLDFGEGKLLVRKFLRGYLCVLAEAGVNQTRLRTTTRLVARSLPREFDREGS